MIPLNDLSRKSTNQISQELEALEVVMRSGHYLKGNFTREFESVLGERIRKPYVLGLGNGTDALKIAMQGLGLRQGDLVAVAPNAGGYSTTAAKALSLEVGLVDVDEEFHQISPVSLEKFLKSFPKTRAVVLTHLYGKMGNVQEIKSICQKFEVFLIEDCAQSFGAELNGFQAGSIGDAATFSFYPTKNLGAAGDAGAVAFSSKNHYEAAAQLSQYGWRTRYLIELNGGSNSRMDEIQAALLLLGEKSIEVKNRQRREIVTKYLNSASKNVKIIGSNDVSFVGHLAVVVSDRRENDLTLFKQNEVETTVHYPVLDSDQPAWRGTFVSEEIPQAKVLVNQIYTVPCFPELYEDEIEIICKTLANL